MINVRAHREWDAQRVRVMVTDDDHGVIFGRDGAIYHRAEFAPGATLPDEVYVLSLSDRHFEQILAALNELHTGEKAPGDAYALRRDLDREAGRVDKMLDVVLDLAHNQRVVVPGMAATGPPGPKGDVGPMGPRGPKGDPGYGPDSIA